MDGRVVSKATVFHVIVRACALCGGQRVIGEPCASCGNPAPPRVEEIGVASATYRNPVKRAWWALIGKPAADRRIARANENAKALRGDSWPTPS